MKGPAAFGSGHFDPFEKTSDACSDVIAHHRAMYIL